MAADCLVQGSPVPFPLPASKAKAVLKGLGAEHMITDEEQALCCTAAQQLELLLGGRLSETEASYRLPVSLGHELVYLHSHNVVHGDLKTDNVLLGSDGTPKLPTLAWCEQCSPRREAGARQSRAGAQGEPCPI